MPVQELLHSGGLLGLFYLDVFVQLLLFALLLVLVMLIQYLVVPSGLGLEKLTFAAQFLGYFAYLGVYRMLFCL